MLTLHRAAFVAPLAATLLLAAGAPSSAAAPLARVADRAGKLQACGTSVNGVVADGQCADDNEHGTHVAGTIGALANNGEGVAGVAFDSPLIVCKALGGQDGSGTDADVAACIRWTHAK